MPAGGRAAPAHPFAGITVVEFGYFYAMPYGATMLASLGARVIKLEDRNGDPHRTSFGPEVASNKTTAGKESISVDLRTPEGRAIAQELLATADVFLTGFRSGVAEKFGLGYEELRAINPRLLYVHAAGYGTDGPYAHRALYAQAAQAVGGSFGRQVGYWSDPANNVEMSRRWSCRPSSSPGSARSSTATPTPPSACSPRCRSASTTSGAPARASSCGRR